MGVPQTFIHNWRVVDQVVTNLVGLQRDMRANAVSHRAVALSASKPITEIAGFMADCGTQYLRRLGWVNDLLADGGRHAALTVQLGLRGMADADVTAVLVPLHDAVVLMGNAPRATYAEIVAACDAMIAEVQAPDSLWPE